MRRRARLLVLAGLALLPVGCGGLLPPPAPPPALYRLSPANIAREGGAPLQLQLLVEAPTAPAAIDTTRIALSRGPTSVDYFADAAWTDRAPRLVHALIAEALESAGRIEAVARDTLELRADALLLSDLRHFEAEYHGGGPPAIRIEIDCRLVKMPERSIIATRSFAAEVAAGTNETAAIVDGFNEASHEILRQIAPWAAASLAGVAR
ncbi:MAG TPA: ABC-type transport auxiliary lipoprotein family protein [Stellaceae bacterium]|nr:ABC-type transport auxiliary lipoprotein family protein [Stellaceae bacterium]